MWQIKALLVLKLVSFVAATAQTIGFIGFFAFEVLAPYKWPLLSGGTIALLIAEGVSYLLAKRMAGGSSVDRRDRE
jgi:hypothetical protein